MPPIARALVAFAAFVVLAPPASASSGDVAYDAGLQWGLETIEAETAWTRGRGAGVTIAVVDSGVAVDHEDLAGKLVAGVACRNTGGAAEACTGKPLDDDGHGTHVAGIAAATTGNGLGVAGTAPDAAIMPIKVLFKDCADCLSSGTADDVSAAIRWATDRGADIINLSLGSTTSAVFGPGFVDAIQYAWDRGAIPVVAAGNDYILTANFGDAPAVVVSATTRDDTAPTYSNGVGSARWALAAPGGEGGDDADSCSQSGVPRGVLSTYWAPGDTAAYACLSGTSMAAPHVSGGLAILLGLGLEPKQAIDRLRATAVDVGTAGTDSTYGAGRIDLAAATAGLGRPTSGPATTVTTAAPSPTTSSVVVAASSPSTATTVSGEPAPTTTAADDPVPTEPPPPTDDQISAPQPFDTGGDPDRGLPALLVALAVAGVLASAAGTVVAGRRLLR